MAAETIRVTLRAPAGGRSVLSLCRTCYASDYLPLACKMGGAKPMHDGMVLIVGDAPDIREFTVNEPRGESLTLRTAPDGRDAPE